MKEYVYTFGFSCIIVAAAALAGFDAVKKSYALVPISTEPEAFVHFANSGESISALTHVSMGQEKSSDEATEAAKDAVDAPDKQDEVVQPKPKSNSIISIVEMTDESAIRKTKPRELYWDPDSNDPGRISTIETRPFPVDTKPLNPMDLLTAQPNELHVIMGAKDGPSPIELQGTWEILPCHSDSGPIGRRSFDVSEVAAGTGAYFETVQLYSDKANKKLSDQYETTLYVKIDDGHILAAKHPGTEHAVYSVLKKVDDVSLPMDDQPKALIERKPMSDKEDNKKEGDKKKDDKKKDDKKKTDKKPDSSDSGKKMDSKKDSRKSKKSDSKKMDSKKMDSKKSDSTKMESKKMDSKKMESKKKVDEGSSSKKSAKKKPATKKPATKEVDSTPESKGKSIIRPSRRYSST